MSNTHSPSRTFVITGGTKGIGLATAKLLAAAGHSPIAIARSASEDFPGEVITCDLGNRAQTSELAARLAERHIDGVVNNVGLVRPARLGEVDHRDLEDVLDLNLRPALDLTQALLPQWRHRRWGRIVNITSLVVLGAPHRTAYAAAKAALTSFTRSWALELALDGITVNAVAPGPTETELFRENNPPGSDGERRYIAMVPMRRLGQSAEIASAVSFLLSESSAFITGQTLHVDGGASIGRSALG